MSRTINAPGIELREFDQSNYDLTKQDNSIVNTVALINGFADVGEDYTTQWVNSKNTLLQYFGVPTNEPEQYFYNAAIEVLNRGGICLMSKLPYDNPALNNYAYVDYKINAVTSNLDDCNLSGITSLDPSITKCIKIDSYNDGTHSGLMSLKDLDELKTSYTVPSKNTIKIIDVTHKKYESLDVDCVSSEGWLNSYTNDCLGIVPVLVAPTNAIYFQNYYDAILSDSQISDYNNILSIQLPNRSDVHVNYNKLNTYTSFDYDSVRNLSGEKTYESINFEVTTPSESLSKNTILLFPEIQFLKGNNSESQYIDHRYLNSIGVVVVKLFKDSDNSNMINYLIVESFVGSLDKTARDENTKQSTYIDDVVNSQSKYINLFSNIDRNLLVQSNIVHIANQTGTTLGLHKIDLLKNISYENSITKALNIIFNKNANSNKVQLDLVVDAGVTNLALLTKYGADGNKIDFSTNVKIRDFSNFVLEGTGDSLRWLNVAKQYDNFCKNTRRDCMYLADGLRTFCLEGDEKRVRSTKLNSSISKDILTKLKYITGLNSNYSAGYCDWFLSQDNYSGDYFWIPPSIKAAGIYMYTDTYFHKWDAPAGIIRGKINNIIDCAFSPVQEEAGKLYSQAWNYAVNYPIDGLVLEGLKTFQLKKTAFDRVNVRRLFLYLEKSVIRIAKYFVYEMNTEYLRLRFVDTIKPIFDDAVNGFGISQYVIKCDNTNNTEETIDRHELHCQIAIKPIKTIEFIVLDFVCTNQSATVNETIFENINA